MARWVKRLKFFRMVRWMGEACVSLEGVQILEKRWNPWHKGVQLLNIQSYGMGTSPEHTNITYQDDLYSGTAPEHTFYDELYMVSAAEHTCLDQLYIWTRVQLLNICTMPIIEK